MVDLASIRQALLASEHLSFRQAASAVGVRPSAISRRVQSLEDELGVSLFERSSGGIRTTAAGRRFFERARSAMAELDLAVTGAAVAGRAVSGDLSLGVFSSIVSGFPHTVLATYLTRYPDVALSVSEGGPREHFAKLRERRIDVAFVIGVPQMIGLDHEPMWTERLYVAVGKEHHLSQGDEISWKGLWDERFIVCRDEPGPEIHDHVVRRMVDLGHHPHIERFDVGREALMALVGLGVGVTLVSEAATAVAYPGVTFRQVLSEEDLLSFGAVWSPDNDNPSLRRFLATVRELKATRKPLSQR